MSRLRIDAFGGIAPKIDKRKLPPLGAQTARNCRLDSGALEAMSGLTKVADLADAVQLSIYKYRGSWLSWPVDVDVVRSPLADDQYDRIMWSGEGTPKIRGLVNGSPETFDLGIPYPTAVPTVEVQAKTATSWTRTWHYFYEEPDGTRKDEGTLTEGVDITETTPGKTYTVSSIPARSAASTAAVFILWFDGYSAGGTWLGRVYSDLSAYESQTDLYIDGAPVTAEQVNGATAVLTLLYDSGSAQEYDVERSYVYTFISRWGEESAPSDPSIMATVDPTQDAELSGIQTSAHPNVEKVRIYRTVTGDAGTFYKYVAEINNGTANFTDTLTDADTAETLPSEDWDPPPAGLQGLCVMAGEFLAGFVGKTVYFCVPNYPHAWPVEWGYNVDFDIVGIKASGNTLSVVTTGMAYLMTGPDPESITVSKVPNNQACSSKRGIVEMGGAILYPSPDGYVVLTNTTGPVLTDAFFDKTTWATWSPASMIAASHDNTLFIFNGSGGLMFRFGSEMRTVRSHDIAAQGLYVDLETDTLYIIQGAAIYSWETGAALTAVWKSPEVTFDRLIEWSWIRVLASAYPVTIRLYANDTLVLSLAMDDDEARRLPDLRPEKFWTVEVETTGKITEISLGQSMEDFP